MNDRSQYIVSIKRNGFAQWWWHVMHHSGSHSIGYGTTLTRRRAERKALRALEGKTTPRFEQKLNGDEFYRRQLAQHRAEVAP